MTIYLRKHTEELQRVYSMLYENIFRIQNDTVCTEMKLMICISALTHALIPEPLEGKYEFLEYIVKHIVTNRSMRDRIVLIYYESIVFLWIKEKLDFQDKMIVAEIDSFFRRVACCVKNDIVDVGLNMRLIMELWFNNTTERSIKWERIEKIEELMSPYSENDFISYLYYILYGGRSTDDTAVSV